MQNQIKSKIIEPNQQTESVLKLLSQTRVYKTKLNVEGHVLKTYLSGISMSQNNSVVPV